MKHQFSKIFACILLCLVLICVAVSCGEDDRKQKADGVNTFRAMVSLDKGANVEGDNPLIVEKGQDASFKVYFDQGYAFSHCDNAEYDERTGLLTIKNIEKHTNVDLYTVRSGVAELRVECDEGAIVEGANSATVTIGGTVSFKVNIKEGYIFKSCNIGEYDTETGILTVTDVKKETKIIFETQVCNFNPDEKVRFTFKGDVGDTCSKRSGEWLKYGTAVTVRANDSTRYFLGWSLNGTLEKGGKLLSHERVCSFTVLPEYVHNKMLTVFANYVDGDAFTYDVNGGTIDASSNMLKNKYFTAKLNNEKLTVTYNKTYLDVLGCASTFWDSGIFSRDGYILKEYNTKPDGTGEAYSIGSKVPLISKDGYLTLYCIWAKATPSDVFLYNNVKFGYPKNVDKNKAPHWITDESIIIAGYTGNERTVVIPEKIGDKYVTAIASDAFVGKDIETLIMGRRILKVEDGAFKGCNKLETIYYPDGIFVIGNDALDKDSYRSFKHLYVNATLAPRFKNGADGAFATKLSRLMSTEEENRIIVIAGSSTFQGLSTEYLQKLLKDDYKVVNFGTTRTTHGTMYLEAMKHFAHKDDVIIYAPENSAYMLGEMELYWKTLRDMEGMNNIFRYVDISNYSNVFGAFSDFNRTYRYKMNPRTYEEVCEARGTNKYGEYQDARRQKYVDDSKYIDSYYITLNNRIRSKFEGNWNDVGSQDANKDYTDLNNKTWCSMDDKYYKDNMNRVIECAKSSGAKVYFGFCPVDESALVEEANSRTWLEAYDKFIESNYVFDGRVGSCMNYIYDHKYFYDCAFHVNDYGRAYRTYRVYRDLCRLIGRNADIGFKDCGTDFEGCLFEDSNGEPLTQWQPKNP